MLFRSPQNPKTPKPLAIDQLLIFTKIKRNNLNQSFLKAKMEDLSIRNREEDSDSDENQGLVKKKVQEESSTVQENITGKHFLKSIPLV